ncbi:MAG: acetate--CoA ligase family protein, partial [Candidatus Eisenbacteria sp.]|nr:acetate--CoA ligase family protein [Candidatus Eisenbacteria bacterium]
FGVSIMEYMGRMNIGFSSFVSTGNSADITSDALIAHWARDPSTSIIAAYMESFGDPRMFLQAARGTTKHKPIIVVKSGRTPAGQRAASSHTGALAGTDTVIDAFLHQCGVIRSNSISEMQSLVAAFSRCHLPKGNRVAILTNSGGPGIMATDSLIAGGMEMARFEEETLAQLRGMMPTEAAIAANPVDFTASGVPGTYRDVLSLLLDDPNVDIVIPIFVPPLMVTPADVARAITEALRSHNTKEGPGGHVKPVFGVIMAEESSYQMVYGELPDCPPIYPFTEMAAGACIEMHRYAEWQRRPEGTIHRFTARTDEARAILRSHRKAGRVQIPAADGMRILACYGLPTTATQEVETVGEALESAREIGYPVSLKAAGRKLAHKSDTGAVMLGIRNDAELRDACVQVQGAIERAGHGPGDEAWVVQGMVKPGREVILGASVDPIMGPSITFGTGGKYVEILRDVVTRIPPITDLDAEEMVRSVRGHALLSGVRGEEAVALGFLGKCLMRFSQMVLELDEITQVDLNPFILHPNPSECAIVDARIWVGSS